MKKSIVFFILLMMLIPSFVVFAGSDDPFKITFHPNYSKNQIERFEVHSDITEQIKLFEETIGVPLPDDLSIVVCPDYALLSAYDKKNNSSNVVCTADTKEITGKSTPIFAQLIKTIWTDCPRGTTHILSTYLGFKYFEIELLEYTANVRYAFSSDKILKNPDGRNQDLFLQTKTLFLAVSRIFELEDELEKNEFQKFLYSMRYGINGATRRILGLDFKTFIRSLKFTRMEDGKKIRLQPDSNQSSAIVKIEELNKKVWSDLPYLSNKIDWNIRQKPSTVLGLATIQLTQNKSAVEVLQTLDGIDDYFKSRKEARNHWWIVVLICSFALLILLAFSLLKGFRFKNGAEL